MKVYTRTGDDGTTGLFGGGRVPKHDPRVAAYGSVDELNSVLGLALCEEGDPELLPMLRPIQHELFAVGARLAAQSADAKGLPPLPVDAIARLEREMDRLDQELSPLRNFILPGGTRLAATLHLARTVCRRAERDLSAAREGLPGRADFDDALKYLNRLSDWLFVMARAANHRAGLADIPWLPTEQKDANA
jgi:cob(I)alamin adenosyltransferase